MSQQPINSQMPINNQPLINSLPPTPNQPPTNSQMQKKPLTKVENIIKQTWNALRWICIAIIIVIITGALAAALATGSDDFNKNELVIIVKWLFSPALGARLLLAAIIIFALITLALGILAQRIKAAKETPDSDYIYDISSYLKDAATNSAKYNDEFVKYQEQLIKVLNQGQIPLIFSSFYALYKETATSKKEEFVKQNTALNEHIEKLTAVIDDLKQANVSQLEELNNNIKSLKDEVVNLKQDNLTQQQELNKNLKNLTAETSVGANMLKQYVQQQVFSNLPPEQLTTQ